MVLLHRKLNFFKDPVGGPTFSRAGSNFFQGGGVQMLILIETHIRTQHKSEENQEMGIRKSLLCSVCGHLHLLQHLW